MTDGALADTVMSSSLPPDLAPHLKGPGLDLDLFEGRVRHSRVVGSTNDIAARLAGEGAPEGTTVVADAQTAGRGRRGRSWHSPSGEGLYGSVILRPGSLASGSNGPGLLTLAAGVALTEAVRGVSGVPVEIKWPNDVVVRRPAGGDAWRKLAGILAEAAGPGPAPDYVVLGFGINLRAGAVPPELEGRMTSLEAESRDVPCRGVVLAAVLAALARRYRQVQAGRAAAMLDRWRELAPTSSGQPVRWAVPGGERAGTTEGIDPDGALRIRTVAGIERVIAGEVTWLPRPRA